MVEATFSDKLPKTKRNCYLVEFTQHTKQKDKLKNKETVLTPWRVVNMHLSDTLGGYDFYDETHTNLLEEPRFVNQGKVTSDTLSNPNSNILEINSKSGLYPLYVAYSIYRKRCSMLNPNELTKEKQLELWDKTVRENVYVICKTPMARSITKRTLVGYRRVKINAHAFDDLIMQLKDKPEQFKDKILRGNFWNKEVQTMKFDAIVGNPPYQIQGGSGGNNDAPIYQVFAKISAEASAKYISLIMPARWFAAGRENLLGEFRTDMINNKSLKKMVVFANGTDVFSNVEIKGGVCYYLIDKNYNGCCEYIYDNNGTKNESLRDLSTFDVIIREPKLAEIIQKVKEKTQIFVDSIISNDTPFGISSNPKSSKKNPMFVSETLNNDNDIKLYHIENLNRKVEYINRNLINKNKEFIDKDKVFIPGAGGSGNDPYVLGKPIVAPKKSVCSQSFLFAAFDDEIQSNNFKSYLITKFFRALVSAIKISQSAPNRVYKFVPLQDFTNESDIDWSKSVTEIDKQLYKKYNLTQEEIDFIEKTVKPME